VVIKMAWIKILKKIFEWDNDVAVRIEFCWNEKDKYGFTKNEAIVLLNKLKEALKEKNMSKAISAFDTIVAIHLADFFSQYTAFLHFIQNWEVLKNAKIIEDETLEEEEQLLKEKLISLNELNLCKECKKKFQNYYVFPLASVETSLKSLIEFIERRINMFVKENMLSYSECRKAKIDELKTVKEIIKKWFPDIFDYILRRWK